MAKPKKPTKLQVRALTAGTKPDIHFHPEPRCTKGTHNPACDGKAGIEITCNLVRILGKRVCVCTHLKN